MRSERSGGGLPAARFALAFILPSAARDRAGARFSTLAPSRFTRHLTCVRYNPTYGYRTAASVGFDAGRSDAVAEPVRIARRVCGVVSPETSVRFVAGSDVAFDKRNGRGVGAVVVLAYPSLEVRSR